MFPPPPPPDAPSPKTLPPAKPFAEMVKPLLTSVSACIKTTPAPLPPPADVTVLLAWPAPPPPPKKILVPLLLLREYPPIAACWPVHAPGAVVKLSPPLPPFAPLLPPPPPLLWLLPPPPPFAQAPLPPLKERGRFTTDSLL